MRLAAGLLAGVAYLPCIDASLLSRDAGAPTAKTLNGSYYGVTNLQFGVEHFLGMPFAQPPVGDLRLRAPQSTNSSWIGLRNATEYGYGCVGFGEDTYVGAGNYVDEDCLSINVVRPIGFNETAELPVLVWIYGGGFAEGTALDQRYNLTFIVEESARSSDIISQKVSNLGLRDQRLALHWIQENIRGFGGDPDKVTIWGESAGGISVGYQLMAYNGRNDGLFRAAIAESGAPASTGIAAADSSVSEDFYQDFVNATGCSGTSNAVQCLRELPASVFYDAQKAVGADNLFTTTMQLLFHPRVDGDIVARNSLDQLRNGSFVKVPIIIGDNSDEGTAFAPFGVNSDDQIEHALGLWGMDSEAIATTLQLYPNDPEVLVIADHPEQFDSTIGLQWKRIATIFTDVLMVGPRKLSIAAMVQHHMRIWTYRFNTVPNSVPDYYGVTHFMEQAWTMHNLVGTGYTGVSQPFLGDNPFANKPQSYTELASLMSGMWIRFVNNLDPNDHSHPEVHWSRYRKCSPTQIVFDAIRGTHEEAVDALRSKGTHFLIDYMWSHMK